MIEQTYAVPYLAHATMEPMNCTAWIHDGGCEVWTGAQNMLTARAVVAKASGLPFEDITVHPVLLGGGFGRRGSSTMDYARQAVQIAAHVPHPVKLVWTREDDIRHDVYRPAQVSYLRAALDDSGRAVAWQQDYVGKHDPQEATIIPYAIANQRVRYAPDETPIPFGPWRSVDHSQHAFFIEAFIDELAEAAGSDPLAFRIAMLGSAPRHRRLLERVAERSNWNEPLPNGHGRGVALVESFGSIVAEVVEVSVVEGEVAVQKVVVVADTGEVIHPDSLHGQLESGVIFGLTAALFGEITIEGGAVVESNFPDYEMLRMATAPDIETVLAPTPGAPIGGVGEIATPPVAPALVNAIFQANGERIRELPVRKSGLRPVARRKHMSTEARGIA